MVATVKCEEIALEKLRLLQSDKEWLALEEAAASSLVADFSTKISTIFDIYLSQYDSECVHYENEVRGAKREYLMSEASKVVRNAYMNTLNHRRSDALQRFDAQLNTALSGGGGFVASVQACKQSCERLFDEQCGSDDPKFSNSSDVSAARRELVRDIGNKSLLVRDHKLLRIVEEQLERLSAKFSKEIKSFLNDANNDDVWGRIRSLLKSESDAAAMALPSAVADLEVDQTTLDQIVDDLKQSVIATMVNKFKEETDDVVTLLKRRFVTALIPKDDEESDEIEEVIQPTKEDAYLKCVKLLSTMAVIRLDEREGEGDDHVDSVLLSTLVSPAADPATDDHNSPDPLASLTWEDGQVPPTMTLITPVRCRDIWNQFKTEMERDCANVVLVQGQPKKPLNWVMLGLLALGGVIGFLPCCMDCKDMWVLKNVVKTIGKAVEGLARATLIMDAIHKGSELWQTMSEAINFNDLCESFGNILEKIKEALGKLHDNMKSTLENAGEPTDTIPGVEPLLYLADANIFVGVTGIAWH